jgi:hypothetical protein
MKFHYKKIRLSRHLLSVAFTVLWLPLPSFAATSASKNGVTWTFDRDCITGQYANGDPWVVGPVTITSISPLPIEGRHGTMINPNIGSSQGFDNGLGSNPYVSALNVGKNLPITVATDSSVVSSITADAYIAFGTIQMFSILTVVQNAPAVGSFRPPAVGNGSRASVWNESQLDYSKLNTLARAPLTAAPSISSYAQWFSYPWLEIDADWTGRYLHPLYMAEAGYGRELAVRTGTAALLLNLDYTNTEKRDLLVGVVQAGIDNYGFVSKGGVWYNDGGHNIGRLSPLIIAAGVLNDNNMKSVIMGSAMKFQEFQTTFFVSQEDVDRLREAAPTGDAVHPYTVSNIGLAEWGIRHTSIPQWDNNYWAAAYRDINALTFAATTMAAKVMGLRSTINWEPLFQYTDRYLDYEQSAGYAGEFAYNPTPVFFRQFYNTYKNATLGSGGPVIVVSPVATFSVGDRIQVSNDTNVLSTGALTATLLGVQIANSTGTIVGGPIAKDANNITWWQVDFDAGADGWSGQDNFVKLAVQKPSKPEGLRVVK